MIIFAGWGILAVLVPGVLAWIGWAVTGSNQIGAAIGLAIGAVADWFLGIYFNKTRPAQDLAKRMDARSAQLHALADAGQFYRGPGYLPPTSLAEAHQQANDLAIEEYAAVKNKVGNRHTLFWIPMQYWAFIAGAFAIVVLITGIAAS